MKKAEAIEKLTAGTPCLIGNIMGSKAERIKWRDGKTGQAKEAPVLRHVVVTATSAISVSERVPDDFNEKTYKSPWKRDARVFVELSELKNVKGSVSGTGLISPLED